MGARPSGTRENNLKRRGGVERVRGGENIGKGEGMIRVTEKDREVSIRNNKRERVATNGDTVRRRKSQILSRESTYAPVHRSQVA